MFHTCVEVRIQNMQKFYAISQTNGRPDLTNENSLNKKISLNTFFFHWIKIYYLYEKKSSWITFFLYILIEYKYIFFEWQNSYKQKYFFD